MSNPHENPNPIQEKLDEMTPSVAGALTVSRAVSDARFWKSPHDPVTRRGGLPTASEKQLGALLPTDEMYDVARSDMQEAFTDRYLQETAEGKQIKDTIEGLVAVTAWVHDNREVKTEFGTDYYSPEKMQQRKARAFDFMQASGMNTEEIVAGVDRIASNPESNATDFMNFNNQFEGAKARLLRTARSLAADPRYDFEDTILFDPTGQIGEDANLQRGGYAGVSPRGDLLVVDSEGKTIHTSLEQLDVWNGRTAPVLAKRIL